MRRPSRAALATLLLAALVAACATSLRRPGAPAEPVAAASTPKQAASGPVLRVYAGFRGTDYEPFHRWDRGAPAPIGLEPDLIRAVARELRRPVLFVEPPAHVRDPRVEMLTSGLADVVISTFSITPERGKLVAFSRPYFVDGAGVLVRRDAPFRRPADLSSGRIITVSGTTGDQWVRAHWPAARVLSFPGAPCEALAAGIAEGYVNDRSHLHRVAATDGRCRLLDGYLTREPWGIAVARTDAALLAAVDAALVRLETSGELAALRARWLGR